MNHAARHIEFDEPLWCGSPHVFGFLTEYVMSLYYVFLAIFGYRELFESGRESTTVLAQADKIAPWAMLVFVPLFALTIKRIQVRWIAWGILYVALALWLQTSDAITEPFRWVLLCLGIVGILLAELHRRAFRYTVYKDAIVTEVSGLKRWQRMVPLSKISDLVLDQSFIGRFADIGSVIPVTDSGLGLGSDSVVVGLSAGARPAPLLTGSLMFGGIRGRHRPRTEPQFMLFAVRHPQDVMDLIGGLIS